MNVAHRDWLEFVRDRRLVALAVLALLIALAALATSYARHGARGEPRRGTNAGYRSLEQPRLA